MTATVAPYSLPTYYRLPTTVRVVLNVVTGNVVRNDNARHAKPHSSIHSLPAAEPDIHHLRDGDVVLFRVPRSKFWQARYKLLGGKWQRFSTRQRRMEDAAFVACDRYDEARYRERMGLAPVVKRFCDVADACVKDMERDLAAGTGKKVYKDYIQVIERYLVPFFGQKYLTNIT